MTSEVEAMRRCAMHTLRDCISVFFQPYSSYNGNDVKIWSERQGRDDEKVCGTHPTRLTSRERHVDGKHRNTSEAQRAHV